MKKILCLLLILGTLCGCSKQEKIEGQFSGVFNTFFTVIMYEKSQSDFDENFEFIKEEFTYYNNLFDKYNTYEGMNNVKTINDNAGIAPVIVEEDLYNLIAFSVEKAKTIADKVDITLGPVLNVWHNYRELNDGSVPTLAELEAANQYVDLSKLVLNEEESSIFLTDPNMSIDVGATAKGYACELVKDKLIERGVDDFLISAGGNVISYGKRAVKAGDSSLSDALPANKEYYTVSIQSPKTGDIYVNVSKIMAVALINGESVVTSGDYERYFVGSDGVTYHHLIDPETLYPAYHVRSVTVITEDSGLADFLSSTLYLMSVDEGVELINQLDADIEAVWLTNDGKIIHTDGLVEGENCTTSW